MTGETIREIRRSEKLPQVAFAAAIHYTQQHLSRVELGQSPVSPKMAEAVKKAFPQYFEEVKPAEPVKDAWNPATIDFAVRVLSESGWLEQHDREITVGYAMRSKPQYIPQEWNAMADMRPEKPGRYRVKGFKRNGLPYTGISILYPDGKWYTLHGNLMPTPECWQELEHYTETARY